MYVGETGATAVICVRSVSTAVGFLKQCGSKQTHLLKSMLGVKPCAVHPHWNNYGKSAKSNTSEGNVWQSQNNVCVLDVLL